MLTANSSASADQLSLSLFPAPTPVPVPELKSLIGNGEGSSNLPHAGKGGAAASPVVVIFEEILKNYAGLALPQHIFVAEDTFVKGSGRLIGLVGGGQGLLAQYTLANLIPNSFPFNPDVPEKSLVTQPNPAPELELEAVAWCLTEAAVAATNFGLPFAIWLCPKCHTLTASTGEETILGCTGCQYIFFEPY